jgi:hypothetical protein
VKYPIPKGVKMDIEIHNSVKEIGLSRPEEFGRKIINLKDCNFIKIYPRGIEHYDDFIDLEINRYIRRSQIKEDRIRIIYKLRTGRSFKIKPEVSNSIYIETIMFNED